MMKGSKSDAPIELGVGTFYLMVNPCNNYSKKALFQNASARLQDDQLVIVNLDYEDEQGDLPDAVFSVSPRMNLTRYQIQDDDDIIHGFKWNNLERDGPIKAQLVSFEYCDAESSRMFYGVLSKKLHEIMYPSQQPTEASLMGMIEEEGFVPENMAQAASKGVKNYEKIQLAATTVVAPVQPILPISHKPEIEDVKEELQKQQDLHFMRLALESVLHLYPVQNILFISPAHLYEFNKDTGVNQLLETNIGFLLVRLDPFVYSFDLIRAGAVIMRTIITSSLNYCIVPEERKVMWVELLDDGNIKCWLVELGEDPTKLQAIMARCIFESNTRTDIETSLKPEEKDWIESWNTKELSDTESEEEEEEMDIDWKDSQSTDPSEPLNRESKQSMNQSHTFVAKGNRISIFKEREDSMDFYADLPVVKSLQGEEFEPRKLMLHQGDSRLLFLNPNNKNTIYSMDTERGQIVEEYKVDKFNTVSHINPINKFAPRTGEPTFMSINSKGMYLLDPRIPKPEKLALGKNYSKNPYFTCSATTQEGRAVVASEKGDIRLYSEIGKNAKTALPGLGDTILSVDVTKSGEWVLATTKTYLLVIPVVSHGVNGFLKSITKKRRNPRKLTLKPEDIARYNIRDIKFTPAYFNIGESTDENSIITSTGQYLIVWNFTSVKKHRYFDYKIKPLEETVVGNEFKYGTDTSAVVTMPSRPTQLRFSKHAVRRV